MGGESSVPSMRQMLNDIRHTIDEMDRKLANVEAELNNLGSADDAAMWAHRSLGEKNKLKAPDARRVEEAFQARLPILTANAVEVAGTRDALSMAD